MKKKIIKILVATFVLTVFAGLAAFSASAEREVTEGMYTYYISAKGKAIITKGDPALSGDLVIPDELGGAPVKEIGQSAFSNNQNITSVTFPEALDEIGSYAFANCDGFTSVTVPDSVTYVSTSAFAGCNNVVSVTLGNGLTDIGNRAFASNTSLKDIDFGNSLEIIGQEAFYGCTVLETVVIPDNVKTIGQNAFDHCTVLDSVTLGNGLTQICRQTFYACKFTEIVIPDSVEIIDKEAFQGSNVKRITIGKGVKDIGDAFSSCKKIEFVSIDEENPYYSSDNEGVIFNKDKTTLIKFPLKNQTESYEIPDGVKAIDALAFKDIITLQSVSMPDSLENIGEKAFLDCTKLKDVTLGSGLKKIGYRAFDNCKELTNVYYTGDVAGWCSIYFVDTYSNPKCYAKNLYINGKKVEGELVIPDGLTSIGDYAFEKCTQITYLTIPDSVKYIGKYAFANCHNVELKSFPSAVKEIGEHAFVACSKITSIDLGKELEKIGDSAFLGSRIETVIIPASIKEIGYYAFGKLCKNIYYCGTAEDFSKVILHKGEFSAGNSVEHLVQFNYAPDDFGTISIDDLTLDYKSTANLNPTLNISPEYKCKLIYTSSEPSVATVDENGKVTAKGTGTAIITCRAVDENGYSTFDSCVVTVKYNVFQWIIYIFLFGFLWY